MWICSDWLDSKRKSSGFLHCGWENFGIYRGGRIAVPCCIYWLLAWRFYTGLLSSFTCRRTRNLLYRRTCRVVYVHWNYRGKNAIFFLHFTSFLPFCRCLRHDILWNELTGRCAHRVQWTGKFEWHSLEIVRRYYYWTRDIHIVRCGRHAHSSICRRHDL